MKLVLLVSALGITYSVAPLHAEFPRGEAAPPFALKQLSGKQLSLVSLRGKVVLLDFWGPS